MRDYVRTKTEYQAILTTLCQKFGDTLKLPAIPLNQQQQYGFSMYETKFRTDACHLLFQRIPRDYNSQEGIQRAWKRDKIEQIATAANEPLYTAPGAMVLTINPKERTWVKIDYNNGDPVGWLQVDLKELGSHLSALIPDENDLINEEEFKIGYMIDAHHRSEGHYQGNRSDLEMAAVCYIDLPRKEMARVFSGVNEHQDKPSQTHTMAMRAMADMLRGPEKQALEIAVTMNNDPTSTLYQRIKEYEGRVPVGSKAPYVNLKTMTDLLTRHIVPAFPSNTQMFIQQQVIDSYFRGWGQGFPEAWADEKTHVLVKAMGFTLMSRLFDKVFCVAQSRYQTKTPDTKEFAEVISAFRETSVKLDPDVFGGRTEVNLDWSSGFFGAYSSGKGINALFGALLGHITDRRFELMRPA